MSAPATTAEQTLQWRPQARPQAPSHQDGRPSRGGWSGPATTLAVAGVLCFATFVAGGGLRLQSSTTVEIALTLGSGLLIAGALLTRPAGASAHGVWPVGLMLAFTALTALSVVWSVAPDSSWQDAGRMLAYSGTFAAAVALARIRPRAWGAVLEGVVAASVIVCGYALLTKVFPGHIGTQSVYARLQEPYGYWNAIGLTAALGTIGCMWLGARRSGHALVTAMAYPATGLCLVTLMLAYSRGALAALVVGVAVWIWIVPLRLRSARVLIVGGVAAAAVVAWDFTKNALTSDGVAMAARTLAGHQLGVLLVAMVLVLGIAGVALGFFGDRRAPSLQARRRAGALLVALLILCLAGGAGALAVSRRGFSGTISHAFSSLTDPNAPVPSNTPGRLTAIGSVRARYWKEALDIFDAHPALGVGASGYETARLRYRKETLDVKHAHGYIVQTLADLGIVGLAITLALMGAWLACAARATRPFNRRWTLTCAPATRAGRFMSLPGGLSRGLSRQRSPAPYTPERVGLLCMACLVVVFGVHSLVDWTWYVPGNACVALLCAGWVAGRGPLGAALPAGQRGIAATGRSSLPATANWRDPVADATPRVRTDPGSLAIAAAVLAVALLAAWTQWQPQRSAEGSETALGQLVRNPAAAQATAQKAVSIDPLSAQALFTLSAIQHAAGNRAAARATLQKAVRLQPSNPQTWLALGQYDRTTKPSAAVMELRAAVYLDPRSVSTQNAYVEALRAAPRAAPRTASAPRSRAARRGRRAGRPRA